MTGVTTTGCYLRQYGGGSLRYATEELPMTTADLGRQLVQRRPVRAHARRNHDGC
jgi:hypothetical protein